MNNGKFNLYALAETSPQLLGEIILITTIKAGTHNKIYAEAFALIAQGTPHLSTQRINALAQSIPTVGLTIDEDFMASAALDTAKALVSNRIIKEFENKQNWDIYRTPFTYNLTTPNYLAQVWMLGKWHDELETIRDSTQCYSLRQLLGEISYLPVMNK